MDKFESGSLWLLFVVARMGEVSNSAFFTCSKSIAHRSQLRRPSYRKRLNDNN